jgi:hypothetical protein
VLLELDRVPYFCDGKLRRKAAIYRCTRWATLLHNAGARLLNMILMALPAVLTPLAAVLAALTALVTALATVARPSRSHLPTYHDPEQAIADLTLKVRRPWVYRATMVGRWFDGER